MLFDGRYYIYKYCIQAIGILYHSIHSLKLKYRWIIENVSMKHARKNAAIIWYVWLGYSVSNYFLTEYRIGRQS